jgi:photosystem II stability/assembly factor-like uncharacterized protein
MKSMKTLKHTLFLLLLLFISCEKDRYIKVEVIELEDVIIKSYSFGINNVFDMFFIDEKTGFITGDMGMIKKTTNAGEIWASLESGTKVDLNTVCFINDSIGFVGGDFIRNGESFSSLFLTTVDGGLNWVIDTIPNVARFQDIWFFNENDGIAFLQTEGSGEAVSTTTDGGRTWSNMNLNVVRNNRSWERIFATKNIGYVIGGDDNHTLLKSSDFGKNWTSFQTPVLLDEVNFISNDIDYVGGEGQIYKTENMGANWSKITIPDHVGLFHFFNDVNGINIDYQYDYVGDGFNPIASFIMTTTDGGLNWKNNRIPDIIIGRFSFPSEKKGYYIKNDKFYSIEFK